MISPDELAERLSPPAGTGAAYAAQLYLSDAALNFAEGILDATEPGEHQDQALDQVVAALRTAYAGISPACTLPLATAPAPHLPTVRAPQRADPGDAPAGHDPAGTPALVIDVHVWRLGLMHSRLHPVSRLVGLVVSEACGPSGLIPDTAQPTLHDLGARTGLPLHHLHPHLRDVCEAGWVTRTPWHRDASTASRYQLRLPGTDY